MRNFVALALLLGLPAAHADSFDTPASLEGETVLHGIEWILLSTADGSVEGEVAVAGFTHANRTQHLVTSESAAAGIEQLGPPLDSSPEEGGVDMLRFAGGPRSQMMLVGNLTVVAHRLARLEILTGDEVRAASSPFPRPAHRMHMWDQTVGDGVVFAGEANLTVAIQAADRIDFAGVRASCAQGCGWTGGYHHVAGAAGTRVEAMVRESLEVAEGSGSVRTVRTFFVAYGSRPDAFHSGNVRLPLASFDGCDTCHGPATLRASGEFRLEGLQQQAGRIDGDIVAVGAEGFLDETPLGRAAAFEVGIVPSTLGLAVGLAVLTKLVAAAIMARSVRQPLQSQRRRILLQQVQLHPGATFRELVRRSGIPAGTARHHLTILGRAGLVVEHGHRATRRFFENHGRFAQGWAQVVALREPGLQELHDWISAQDGGTPQKEAIQHFEALGWSRSTTQHRLARLVDHGALHIRQQGRLKLYSARAPTAPDAMVRSQATPKAPGPPASA